MPAWLLARLGIRALTDPKGTTKKLVYLLMGILAFLVILSSPMMLIFMPYTDTKNYDNYFTAAYEINQEDGMYLNWQEMIAIDAVLLEQDFGDDRKVKEIKQKFRDIFIYEEKFISNGDCVGAIDVVKYTTCQIETTVKKQRTLAEAMEHAGLDAEQQERVMVMLENDMTEMLSEANQEKSKGMIGSGGFIGGTAKVSDAVLRYEPVVRKYAVMYGVEQYVPYLLAMMMRESGGRVPDVMQSSESKGWPRNTIQDPIQSIQVGVSYFAEVLGSRYAKGDLMVAIQSYNFGGGFAKYALERGGYSLQTAQSFSQMMAARNGRSRYGDPNYVPNVLVYMDLSAPTTGGSGAAGAQKFDFQKMYATMRQYEGMPYRLGGRTPGSGFFDCSGLLEWCFAQIGVNFGGTAATMYQNSTPVNESNIQPGDLVFFDTDDELTDAQRANPSLLPRNYRVSHVGMYIGNGKFYQASGKGVNEGDLATWKRLYRFLGFRRM